MRFLNPGRWTCPNRRVWYFTFVLAFCIKIQSASVIPQVAEDDAMTYLKRFGYLPDDKQSSAIISKSTVSQAVADFQKFAGLEATGVLDNDTLKTMAMPRCGMKDKLTPVSDRVKRFLTQGSKWDTNYLRYKIINYPQKTSLGIRQVDKEFARAFSVWSDHTDLIFQRVIDGPAEIEIKFVTRYHGDESEFNGAGGVLAHAYYPIYGGDIHFDNDEYWTIRSHEGVNLFQVAAHEIGHALGLAHSENDSLMAPIYRGYQPNFQLPLDDIRGIQAIYGPKTIKPTTPAPRTDNSPPDLCTLSKIDAVFHTDNNVFFFRGKYYWKMVNGEMVDRYPKRISDTWPGLPGNIDAAFSLGNTYTYFFKGSKYWRYTGEKLDDNYPNEISAGFRGVPNYLDAATVISSDVIIFFKGSDFYTYNWRTTSLVHGPSTISKAFPLVQNGVDAAYTTFDSIFFFRDSEYFTYRSTVFPQLADRGLIKTKMFSCPHSE